MSSARIDFWQELSTISSFFVYHLQNDMYVLEAHILVSPSDKHLTVFIEIQVTIYHYA